MAKIKVHIQIVETVFYNQTVEVDEDEFRAVMDAEDQTCRVGFAVGNIDFSAPQSVERQDVHIKEATP